MRKCDRQPTIHKSQPLCTTEPTSTDSRYHSLAHYQFGHQLCVPVYRGDYVRHQRVSDRQQSFHSWRDVGLLTAEAPAKAAVSYLLLLFLETWQCELQPSHAVYISSLTKKRVRMFYQNWMTLLRFTQGDQGIPWLHPLSISSQNWLLWWWPTPKPLIRSLFSFRASKCELSSSPLCAAKLAQSNAWPQIWSPQAFPYR